MFICYFVVFFLNYFDIVNGQISCTTALQCASTNITESSGVVQCYGYRSCDSSRINTTHSGGDVYCEGAYSCINSDGIFVNDNLQCLGLMSCSNSTLTNTNNEIYCHGEYSCFNSIIYSYGTNSGENFECFGVGSCMESIIYLKNWILFSAMNAGKDSIIHIENNNTVIEFEGAWAGDGATVICDNGYLCHIDCWDNNCNGLTLSENGGSFDVTCYYDVQYSNVCPNGKNLSSFMYEIPNLTNMTMSDVNNKYL